MEVPVGQDYESLWKDVKANGYVRVRVDGETCQSWMRLPTSIAVASIAWKLWSTGWWSRRMLGRRIAESVENGLALGKGVLLVACAATEVSRKVAVGDDAAQPASGMRPVWPQFRAAHSAQLLLQQPARLVPGVRRVGYPDRCESGCPAERSQTDTCRRGRGAVARCRAIACPAGCSPPWHAAPAFHWTYHIEQLAARHRRLIMHGLPETWLDVYPDEPATGDGPRCFVFSSKGCIQPWRKPRDSHRHSARGWST